MTDDADEEGEERRFADFADAVKEDTSSVSSETRERSGILSDDQSGTPEDSSGDTPAESEAADTENGGQFDNIIDSTGEEDTSDAADSQSNASAGDDAESHSDDERTEASPSFNPSTPERNESDDGTEHPLLDEEVDGPETRGSTEEIPRDGNDESRVWKRLSDEHEASEHSQTGRHTSNREHVASSPQETDDTEGHESDGAERSWSSWTAGTDEKRALSGLDASGDAPKGVSDSADWNAVSRDVNKELDVDSGAQLLLLSPPGNAVTEDVCSRLLSRGQSERNVVIVTIVDSPSKRLRALHDSSLHGGETVVIDVGSMEDPASTQSVIGKGDTTQGVTVRQVSSPSDISRIGMVVDQVLSDWEDSTRPTVLCFYTLSELLQYVDLERAFQFVHLLQGRLDSADASSHFHIDPEEHNIESLRTLQPVFDEVLRVSSDGDIESVRV